MTNSTHQPFEDWLVSERPLSPYQEQALREHLNACEACHDLKISLQGLDRLFKAAPQARPKPDFTTRWLARQSAERMARQRRQAWTLFGIVLVNALALLSLLGSQVAAVLNSPTQVLLIRAYFVSVAVALADLVTSLFVPGRALPFGLPVVGLMLFTGVASFVSVLWLVAYRQLTSNTRRVTL